MTNMQLILIVKWTGVFGGSVSRLYLAFPDRTTVAYYMGSNSDFINFLLLYTTTSL